MSPFEIVRRRGALLITGCIVIVLGLQLGAAFVFPSIPRLRAPFLWPFMDYPMYGPAWYEGDVIDQYTIHGIFADGTERVIDRDDVGVNLFKFKIGMIHGILDEDPERLGQYMAIYADRHDARPVALRLENEPMILRRDGMEPGPIPAPKVLLLDAAGRGWPVNPVKLWNDYWFKPWPLINLAFLRIALLATLLVELLTKKDYQGWLEVADTPAEFYYPLPILRLMTLPLGSRYLPSPTVLLVIYGIALVLCVLALIGWRTRTSLIGFTLAYIFLSAFRYSFGDFHHPEGLAVIMLPWLCLSPVGAALSVDRLRARLKESVAGGRFEPLDPAEPTSRYARWPILLAVWLLAIAYFSAAQCKLDRAGMDWMNGYTLQGYMLEDGLRWGGMGLWMGEHHIPAVLMGWAAMLFEGTFFLVLIFPLLAWVYVPAGIGLHTGIYLMMRAWFFLYIALYAAMIRWDKGLAWAVRRLDVRGHPEVYYDGRCGLCIGSVTAVDEVDLFRRLRFRDLETDGAPFVAAHPDITLDDLRRRMHMVRPDGTVRAGFFAFRDIARCSPLLWPLLVLLYFPGSGTLGPKLYDTIAGRRSRAAKCTSAACAVHAGKSRSPKVEESK